MVTKAECERRSVKSLEIIKQETGDLRMFFEGFKSGAGDDPAIASWIPVVTEKLERISSHLWRFHDLLDIDREGFDEEGVESDE